MKLKHLELFLRYSSCIPANTWSYLFLSTIVWSATIPDIDLLRAFVIFSTLFKFDADLNTADKTHSWDFKWINKAACIRTETK